MPDFSELCPQLRMMSLATPKQKRDWIELNFQPYQIEAKGSQSNGLMTGYYEPIFKASLNKTSAFNTPLYAPPSGLMRGQKWYTRSEIATNPKAQTELVDQVVYR
jgi:membrane-bound lytic murein transglycosylase A